MSHKNNIELEERIGQIVDEANELAEFWAGTLAQKIIDNDRAELVGAMLSNDYEKATELSRKLEQKLIAYRSEMEKTNR